MPYKLCFLKRRASFENFRPNQAYVPGAKIEWKSKFVPEPHIQCCGIHMIFCGVHAFTQPENGKIGMQNDCIFQTVFFFQFLGVYQVPVRHCFSTFQFTKVQKCPPVAKSTICPRLRSTGWSQRRRSFFQNVTKSSRCVTFL